MPLERLIQLTEKNEFNVYKNHLYLKNIIKLKIKK